MQFEPFLGARRGRGIKNGPALTVGRADISVSQEVLDLLGNPENVVFSYNADNDLARMVGAEGDAPGAIKVRVVQNRNNMSRRIRCISFLVAAGIEHWIAGVFTVATLEGVEGVVFGPKINKIVDGPSRGVTQSMIENA